MKEWGIPASRGAVDEMEAQNPVRILGEYDQ